MKIKLIIGLLLGLITLTSFAKEISPIAIKTDGHVTQTQEKLIANTFLYLNQFWADKGKSLSRELTEKYFTPDTTLIINDRTVYTGYNQFERHFKEVGKNIVGNIHFPLIEILGANSKLVVHFNEELHDNSRNSYPANVIAIFTIKDGRIQRWEEVVNTRYFCKQESAKIVYSR